MKESPRQKSSHTVSHSRSISAMSFCRLAWKEEVVKVIEALIDQCVGRSVGGSKGLNGIRTGSLNGSLTPSGGLALKS